MVRSPAEALRLGLALAAAALIVVAVRTGRSALAGAERDLLRLTSQIPEPLAALFVRTVQYAAVLAPLVGLVVLVATRSFRRLAAIIVAGFLGGVAGRWIMVDLLDLTVGRFRVSDTFRDGIPRRSSRVWRQSSRPTRPGWGAGGVPLRAYGSRSCLGSA